MKLLATTALAFFLGACGTIPDGAGSSDESGATCAMIADQYFISVIEHDNSPPCYFDENHNYTCPLYSSFWTLYFDGSQHRFSWVRSGDGTSGTYTCSRSGLVFSGEVSNNMNLKALVNGTTIYLMDTSDRTDTAPLQSRSHQYERTDMFTTPPSD